MLICDPVLCINPTHTHPHTLAGVWSDHLGRLLKVCDLCDAHSLAELQLGVVVFAANRVHGQRAAVERVPGAQDGALAHGSPEEAHDGRAEDDEDPGIDDGVDGEEAQCHQVCLVALLPTSPDGVDVHTDL